jgi:transcriptional regulator CtsR
VREFHAEFDKFFGFEIISRGGGGGFIRILVRALPA